MSDIVVNVTSAGAANVTVSNGSAVNATVGNGGAVNVAIGDVSPGNATVVSGTLTINSTTTLAAGTPAYVKNAGTVYAAKLDIGIPAGAFTSVSVGNTTTLSPGSNATVTGALDGSNLTLAFGIPAGAAGTNGANGLTPSFAIGNVTTSAAGSTATVTATTLNNGSNVLLDFTIPRGDPGADGANGTNGTSITLSSATPANLGTASAGTSTLAARADHVHALPTIAYSNLSGVPSNFPTNATLVSGLSTAYAAINHAHNYVTSLNNLAGGLTIAGGSNVTVSAANSTLTISASGGIGPDDAIDGGDYVGQIIAGITFTTQPQSVTGTSTTNVTFSSMNVSIANQASQSLYGVGVSNGSMYALGISGTGPADYTAKLLSSSDNGSTWTAGTTVNTFGSIGSLASMATNGTRTVFAVSTPSGYYSYSQLFYSDSASLATVTEVSGLTGGLFAVRWNGVRFIALRLSGDGGIVYLHSSSDGASWTGRFGEYRENLAPVTSCVVGGVFVVAFVRLSASSYQWVYKTSTDGVTWTDRTLPLQSTTCASSGSRAVFIQGRDVAYSDNGVTWTTASNALPVQCDKIAFAKGLFWAFNSASTSTDACYSTNGTSWSLGTLPVGETWDGAASSGGDVLVFANTSGPMTPATVFARASVSTSTVSANLTVSAVATGGQTVAYQWQSSVDAGSTWANIANATSSTLTLAGLTAADNGTRYRALASATGAATVTSQSAILTVTG